MGQEITAYFPASLVLKRGSTSYGIHFSSSIDGVHWTVPKNVHPSKGIHGIHPVGFFHNVLLTQEPLPISEAFKAFKISQEFKHMTLEEMNTTLNLKDLG